MSSSSGRFKNAKRRLLLSIVLILSLQLANNFCSYAEADLTISPDALVGCRSPDEPNCQSCCFQDGHHCSKRSWSHAGSSQIAGPWYNRTETMEGCPDNCPPCAPCSTRSEQQLRNLLSDQRSCDCRNVEIPVDPCFVPRSCECYCHQIEFLSKECPYSLNNK